MEAIKSLILKTLLESCLPVFSQILVQAKVISQVLFTQKHKRDPCRLATPMGGKNMREGAPGCASPTLSVLVPLVGVVSPQHLKVGDSILRLALNKTLSSAVTSLRLRDR